MSTRRSSMGDVHLGSMNTAERRAAVQREEAEKAAARQEELAAQVSPLNSPENRIRIWERLHALSLPTGPSHKLVRVIAQQTGLTVREIHQEQQRRADPHAADLHALTSESLEGTS